VNEHDEETLAELLLQWEEYQDQGQNVSANDLYKNHPHLAEELARRITVLATVAWLDKTNDLPTIDSPRNNKSQQKILAGRYRFENLVAEGGFAQVWRAYDQELDRFVAIKFPKPTRIQSQEAFIQEARRLAKLNHPGIVSVYDVGRDEGSCFFVSELIEGGTLEELLNNKSYTEKQAIESVIQIADALAYAHNQHIIHQDIKPANILIDKNGRALLADFGINRSALSTGTLKYMSPEQLNGIACDGRTDIYSLGVVLHELVTGSLPYPLSEPTGLRRSILNGVTIGNLSPKLKPICEKALSKDTSNRYQTADQLADDLRRSLEPKPKKGSMWIGLAPILLLAGLTTWMFTKRSETILRADSQFLAIDYSPDGKELLTGNLPNKVQLWDLKTEKSIRKFEGLIDWVRCIDYSADGKYVVAGSGGTISEKSTLVVGKDNIAILWDARTANEIQRFGPIDNPITTIAISPDSKEIVTGSDDGLVRIWDRSTGQIKLELSGHGPMVRSVKFVPKQRWVASAGIDSTIRVWDLDSESEIRCIRGHVGEIEAIACSSNGKWIVSGSKDHTVRLWDIETGEEIKRFDGHLFHVVSVCFSPDDRKVLSGSFDRTLRLWDIATGKELKLFAGHTNGMNTVAFSPDGKQVASGSVDQTARIWNLP